MRLQQFRDLVSYDHRLGDGLKIESGMNGNSSVMPMDQNQNNESQMTMLKPS